NNHINNSPPEEIFPQAEGKAAPKICGGNTHRHRYQNETWPNCHDGETIKPLLHSSQQTDFIRELEQKNEGKTEREANYICCNKTQDYAEQSPARHVSL